MEWCAHGSIPCACVATNEWSAGMKSLILLYHKKKTKILVTRIFCNKKWQNIFHERGKGIVAKSFLTHRHMLPGKQKGMVKMLKARHVACLRLSFVIYMRF